MSFYLFSVFEPSFFSVFSEYALRPSIFLLRSRNRNSESVDRDIFDVDHKQPPRREAPRICNLGSAGPDIFDVDHKCTFDHL